MEKRRLGRGLDALLGTEPAAAGGTQLEIATTAIAANPQQPRKNFDQDELSALAASVRTHGILQPLVVRQTGNSYELVAGERRLRAAREAGLTTVPVRVVNFNDQETLEAALIENIQRTDLNSIEKAHGFAEYLDRYKMTHEQLAQRLGLARSSITNLVNLLDLPPAIQDGLRLGQITEAHAKILRGIKDPERQLNMFKQVVAMGLSVKATELALRDVKEQAEQPPSAPSPNGDSSAPEKTAHVQGLEDELRQRFAIPVEIRLKGQDRGQIVLCFESNDDFMRIMEMLRK
jgi:ParB family transcriptional regulator, chromosome partitioning protein